MTIDQDYLRQTGRIRQRQLEGSGTDYENISLSNRISQLEAELKDLRNQIETGYIKVNGAIDADTIRLINEVIAGGNVVLSQGLFMSGTKSLFINDTANSFMTTGITINQGSADNEIISLKSSDVAHPITAFIETDTFGTLAKITGAVGGLAVTGISDSDNFYGALRFTGITGTANPTDSYGVVAINAMKSDGGTSLAALGNDERVLQIENGGSAVWYINGNGDVVFHGTVALNNGIFSYANNRMYLQNVSTARAIDRTSDVITSTTTVTNTTTETTIFTGTISANDLKAGNIIKVVASGELSNASAADDITIRGYLGSTLLGTFNPAIGNVANAHWDLKADLVTRSVGATGSIAWHAHYNIDGNETEGQDISTVDTTASEDFTITVEWDNAKAGNTIEIDIGFLEWKN